MTAFKHRFGCLGIAAAIASPAVGQKIDYQARFPAKYREAAKLTSVAVLPFRGTDGAAFTSALIGALQSGTLDGKPYFQVKTPEGMNYATPAPPPAPTQAKRGKGRGKGTAPSAASNAASEVAGAIRTGQKLGVAAVYIGEVIGAGLSRRTYTESRQVCENINSGKCKIVTKPVPCTETTVNYSVTPRIISVSTGQIVYSRLVSLSDSYAVCNGEVKSKGTLADNINSFGHNLASQFKRTEKKKPDDARAEEKPVTTDEGLVAKVRENVADAVRYDVSPYNFNLSVEFKPKAPELPAADQVKFRNASEYAKAKRLDRACSDWESLNTSANSGSISLLFNLGVCQEVLVPEDPNSALIFLAKADGLTTRPDPIINRALERVRKMVDAQTEISRQVKPR